MASGHGSSIQKDQVLRVLASIDRKTLIERSGLQRRTIEGYIYKG